MQSLRGTKDYFGKDLDKFEFVIKSFVKILESYGYEKVITPIIENKSLFDKVGEFTDIVSKEMYDFIDKGGRNITLIPELTTPIARMVIQHNFKIPSKIYYISSLFRYERPQKGRYRQLHQIGLEYIGSNSYLADTEIICLASESFKMLSIDFSISINYIGSVESRNQYISNLKDFLSDEINDMCFDCINRFQKNVLRILDCKNQNCKKVLEKSPTILDFLNVEEKENFESIKKALNECNIEFIVDHKMVRGLDYYTNLVFEFHNSEGLAILGGGRYNNLYKELGKDTPAVGLAVGIERIIELLKEVEVDRLDLYLGTLNKEYEIHTFKLATYLREKGIKILTNYQDYKIKKHLTNAFNIKSKCCILFGKDEFEGSFKIRIMDTKETFESNLEDISSIVKNL